MPALWMMAQQVRPLLDGSGLIVNEIGMHGMLSLLQKDFLQPLASRSGRQKARHSARVGLQESGSPHLSATPQAT